MKIGFYDSGLGGLSVLREFIKRYEHEYIYLGDSLRAPYGTKSPQEIISFVYEILDFMQTRKVDLVVSACNTSSMQLDAMDLSPYSFKVISLFETMKKFFAAGTIKEAALLATPSTIASKRYLEWNCSIEAVACPDLVPLVEAGDLSAARARFLEYLSNVKSRNIIVGCTHYSFLLPINYQSLFEKRPDAQIGSFKFIDPAVLVAEQFGGDRGIASAATLPRNDDGTPRNDNEAPRNDLIYCTGDAAKFNTVMQELLGDSYSAEQISLH